jgi:hypothetical protein
MEMKKQVLSFNEFIFEAYNSYNRIMEEENKNSEEPDLSEFDWSKGGQRTWRDAKISDILLYIKERDKGKDYTKFDPYEPVFEWFKNNENKVDEIKDSLLIWVGDNPYYGLEETRKKVAESNPQYLDQKAQPNDTLIQFSKDWDASIDKLKGNSSTDKSVVNSLKVVSSLIKSSGEKGLSVDLPVSWRGPNSFFKTIKVPYLPEGGYKEADAKLIKQQADNFKKRLSIGTKGSYVKSEDNLDLIKADDKSREGLLMEIEDQVQERIDNPIATDGIFRSNKDISSIISKASNIKFSKSESSNEIETEETIPVGSKPQYIKFIWPDESIPEKERDNFSYNFFLDDLTAVSGDSLDGMSKISREVQNAINNAQSKYRESYEVVSIKINSFASTSKVNSSFGSMPKKFSPEGNIKLVEARHKSIYEAMNKKLIDTIGEDYTDSKENKVTSRIQRGQDLSYANAGPAWESVGGESYGQKFDISSYGPLFQAEYSKNKLITPKEFYSLKKRKNDPEIRKDYELTYSGYRKAWVTVTVELKGVVDPVNVNIESDVYVYGNFEAYIEWPFTDRSKPAKGSGRTRYAKPRDNMPKFEGRKIKCTFK